MVLTVPNEYGYVLMAAASTCLVSWVHSSFTVKWRNLSGIRYPAAYASGEVATKDKNAATFNCAQRAHQNFTENHASFLGLLAIAGLKYPILAAYLGVGWTLVRNLYAYGYVSKGPNGRHPWFTVASIISVLIALMAGHASYSIIFGQQLYLPNKV